MKLRFIKRCGVYAVGDIIDARPAVAEGYLRRGVVEVVKDVQAPPRNKQISKLPNKAHSHGQ